MSSEQSSFEINIVSPFPITSRMIFKVKGNEELSTLRTKIYDFFQKYMEEKYNISSSQFDTLHSIVK